MIINNKKIQAIALTLGLSYASLSYNCLAFDIDEAEVGAHNNDQGSTKGQTDDKGGNGGGNSLFDISLENMKIKHADALQTFDKTLSDHKESLNVNDDLYNGNFAVESNLYFENVSSLMHSTYTQVGVKLENLENEIIKKTNHDAAKNAIKSAEKLSDTFINEITSFVFDDESAKALQTKLLKTVDPGLASFDQSSNNSDTPGVSLTEDIFKKSVITNLSKK
jgi:hypothetical protein